MDRQIPLSDAERETGEEERHEPADILNNAIDEIKRDASGVGVMRTGGLPACRTG